MKKNEFPRPVRAAVLFFMTLAVTGLFCTSFIKLFPGTATTGNIRQTIGNLQNSSEKDTVSELTFSTKAADNLSALMGQLQKDPNNTELLLDIGAIFLDAGSYAQSETFIKRALLVEPGLLEGQMMLGRCFYLQGLIEKAATVFSTVLAEKKYPPAMINLALIYKYHLNQPDESKKLFLQVLHLPGLDEELMQKVQSELAEFKS